MKDIDEIRRENLRAIEREFGGPAAAAMQLGMSNSQFTNLRDGAKDSKTGRPRGMRKETARKIELAAGKPAGWLDRQNAPATPFGNVRKGPDMKGKVPLISWVRAGEMCDSPDINHPEDVELWMDCPVPHSAKTYCLEISGDSMDDGGADAYRDGEIIFVDPEAAPTTGRDVVVRTPDNKTTFKRLKEDTEGKYLFGLNGKKIIRVPQGTEFCGVVIFSGRRR